MRVACPNCGAHVFFEKQLEIPEQESRIVQHCDKCGSDVFLLAKFGEQPNQPRYQEPAWLFDHYVTKNKTMAELALVFGVSAMTIQYWVDKHNIPRRKRGRRSDD
tara:strand:- start:246 stop:560 length:315 start_codon:yes stop_codon:yes gene_type:complete